MPATADLLKVEAPQPSNAARKPRQADVPADKQAFPEAIRQVEKESGKESAPASRPANAAEEEVADKPVQTSKDNDATEATVSGTQSESKSTAAPKTKTNDEVTELVVEAPTAVLSLVPARATLSATTALATGLQQTATPIATAASTTAAPQLTGVPVTPTAQPQTAGSVGNAFNNAASTPAPVKEGAAAQQTLPSQNTVGQAIAPSSPELAANPAPTAQQASPQALAQPLQQAAVAATPVAPAAQTAVQTPRTAFQPQTASAEGASSTTVANAAATLDRSAQITATAVQTAKAPERAAPSVLANLEELPTPELTRIDLAARKTAVAATGNSLAGAQDNAALGSLTQGAKPANGGQASAGLQAADTSTPIMLNQRSAPQQPVQQAQTEIMPVQTQPVADTTVQTAATQSAQVQQTTAVNTPQSLSFAQQMAQAAAQPPAQQLGISIARGAREGMDRIEIQLHPAELGRVDVRMELGHDGRIMAVVSAERSDTLEQLRRDIHQLERALADAGFDTDGNSFRFDDGSNDAAQNGFGENGDGTDTGGDIDPTVHPAAAAQTIYFDGIRVDISV